MVHDILITGTTVRQVLWAIIWLAIFFFLFFPIFRQLEKSNHICAPNIFNLFCVILFNMNQLSYYTIFNPSDKLILIVIKQFIFNTNVISRVITSIVAVTFYEVFIAGELLGLLTNNQQAHLSLWKRFYRWQYSKFHVYAYLLTD